MPTNNDPPPPKKWYEASADLLRMKKWQDANPEKVKATKKAYRERNKQKLLEAAREKRNTEERKLYMKAWHEANPEKVKATKKAYRERNKQKLDQQTAAWVKANPEKSRKIKRAWDERNPDARKRYYQLNPELHSAHRRNRKARTKGAEGSHTGEDVKAIWVRQGMKCAVLGCTHPISDKRGDKDVYHVDHIRPYALGGSNWPSNLQILCRFHNTQKANKDENEWAAEHGISLKERGTHE